MLRVPTAPKSRSRRPWRSSCRSCPSRIARSQGDDRMPESVARFTLITAARLLDGTGSAPAEQAALLVENGRVVELGRAADVRAPEGSSVERKDRGDGTLLPGLVDAHTHLVAPGDGTLGDDIAKEDDDFLLLQAAKNARTLLHSGVTTLRENGAKGQVAFSLREGIRRQLAPGPRIAPRRRPSRTASTPTWT